MAGYFHNKKVVVTGGTGLIGIPMVLKLQEAGASVRVVSLDETVPFSGDVEFLQADLCSFDNCARAVDGADIVFHLAGIKGGIGVGQTRAASFLVKNVLMNTLMMEAARKADAGQFVYASSVCIYPPAEVFEEKNAGTGLPHPSDRFGGMSKLVGEMQIDAYRLQYSLDSFLTGRITNTYGPYDNFNPESALVIPALIQRAFAGENPLNIWGDGSAQRDFLYSDEAAECLMLMAERNLAGPYNVASGVPVSVKDIAETVADCVGSFTGRKVDVVFDASKPTGEKYRIASIDKVKEEMGWEPKVDLSEGIRRTVEWYGRNCDALPERYSILSGD